MKTLGIQTINNFVYLQNLYTNPFFLINYFEYCDLKIITINNFMYYNYESYMNSNNYLESFGASMESYDVITDDIVLDYVIQFLITISPNTQFTKYIKTI